MQAAQDHQKSYPDRKRKLMEYEVGDIVMLKVSPWKGVVRFGKRGKLNLRYVGPFKVLAKVGKVAYKLELPQEFSIFVEEPVEIMEREIKRLKRSRIPLVKVRWNSSRGPEFTWEREDSFKQKCPQLFTNRASASTTRSIRHEVDFEQEMKDQVNDDVEITFMGATTFDQNMEEVESDVEFMPDDEIRSISGDDNCRTVEGVNTVFLTSKFIKLQVSKEPSGVLIYFATRTISRQRERERMRNTPIYTGSGRGFSPSVCPVANLRHRYYC
ncbi:hypothetical protein Tco_1344012 [Tanacetum coccineum]